MFVINVKYALHDDFLIVYCYVSDIMKNTLYQFRTTKGITQEELATTVNVSRQTIISIEKGKYAPSVVLALAIARFFKVSVEDIFG